MGLFRRVVVVMVALMVAGRHAGVLGDVIQGQGNRGEG